MDRYVDPAKSRNGCTRAIAAQFGGVHARSALSPRAWLPINGRSRLTPVTGVLGEVCANGIYVKLVTGRRGCAQGRDQYAALLPVYERVLGPEHPDTLAARHNLAYWTGHAGDAAGARDQYTALLPVRERVLGLEHPDTLDTRYDLAYWAREADGDPDAAENWLAIISPCSLTPGLQVSPADKRRITGGARAARLWFIYCIPSCP